LANADNHNSADRGRLKTMSNHRKRLGEVLVSLKLITEAQLTEAVEAQKERAEPLGKVLVRLGYLTEDLLLNALAAQYGVWPWRLDEIPADPAVARKLPKQACMQHQVLPVAIRGDLLLLGMVDPHNLDAIDLARNVTGMRIEAVLCDVDRLFRSIDSVFSTTKSSQATSELVDQALKDFRIDPKARPQTNQISDVDTRPVVGLVNQMLTEAIREGASDIHVEPRADRVDVRFRIDGELRKMREFPISLMPMFTTRIKIMAELDIVEFRVPQDGRVAVVVDGRNVDLRVSVLPNHHGQRIVLRVLDKSHGLKSLDEIGFTGPNLDLFRNLVSKPYGMFLVTGPTGSGKTTTLYAALAELRKATNNVMTCEDPIEYEVDGVNQSQVFEKVGLTFARQLRAILRQDPDIVLVGEIRDAETAETAVRAALTGHMVLSTLHCNDAPSAIPRLLDMHIDPFLLSTSLIGVMAQRLLRKICPHCRTERMATPEERVLMEAYGVSLTHVPAPKGCQHCGNAGFKGRTAIHEILSVPPPVAKVLAAKGSIEEVRNESMRYGYRPMQHGALEMVAKGHTSLDEARRVVFLDATYAQERKEIFLHAA
jgi:type IV pilus assembly protein PilB